MSIAKSLVEAAKIYTDRTVEPTLDWYKSIQSIASKRADAESFIKGKFPPEGKAIYIFDDGSILLARIGSNGYPFRFFSYEISGGIN